MAETDLSAAIAENAAGPVRVSGDAGSVEQHSLKDQIEADKYLREKTAAAKPHRALKTFKMVPPGGG